MKKSMSCLLIIVLLSMSTVFCFGASIDKNVGESIVPMFVGTFSHSEVFKKNTAGVLYAETALTPKEKGSFDKVVITIKITKISSGTVVYNKSFTTSYSDIRNRFFKSVTYTPSTRGAYLMEAKYKCYKNSKIIETLNGVPISASY